MPGLRLDRRPGRPALVGRRCRLRRLFCPYVLGLFAFAAFLATLTWVLPLARLAVSFGAATVAAVLVQAATYRLIQASARGQARS